MNLFGSLFSRKSKEPDYSPVHDFSSVLVDIHSHLIPGIDDGVKDLEESMRMIRGFAELGFKKLVTTPHVMSDYFKNTPAIILEGLEKVRYAIKQEGLDIILEAAAEYYLDEMFPDKYKDGKALCIGNNILLFEISYINPPDNVYGIIFDLQVNKYQPLLAHPERYNYWNEKFDEYVKLKEAGALFQLNINSLTGYYGEASKKTAERLIDAGMIDFIGSDLHGQRHLDALKKVVHEKYFWKLMDKGVRNPELYRS
jgi:tyrosine-protein phosphatase YwqE